MKIIKSLKFLAVVFIVLLFYFAPSTKAQVNNCVEITPAKTVIPEGCQFSLGDNPVTTTNIINNGKLDVGAGTWKIEGSYTQNIGGSLSFRGIMIDLSLGSMKIYNTDFTLNSVGAVRRQDVTVDNYPKEHSSDTCTTVSLSKVIIKNPNANLIINSNCTLTTPKISVIPKLAPILAVGAVPFTFFPALQNLVLMISGPSDLWLLFLRLLAGVLNLFGLKRKPKYWGTVFDSQTKQPLDPVVVRLIDAKTGKVINSAITDLYGHFGFLIQPGQFILTAEKRGYAFPSKISTGTTDQIYQNLYHGQFITITSQSDVISPNIPMDRLGYDFNQEAKKKIIKFHPRLSWAIYIITFALFWVGFVIAIFNFILASSVFNGVVLSLYLILLLFRFIGSKRLWGRVWSVRSREALPNLTLELTHDSFADILVGRAKTDYTGKYLLKAQPGQYVLKVKEAKSTVPILTETVIVGKNAVFNKDIKL